MRCYIWLQWSVCCKPLFTMRTMCLCSCCVVKISKIQNHQQWLRREPLSVLYELLGLKRPKPLHTSPNSWPIPAPYPLWSLPFHALWALSKSSNALWEAVKMGVVERRQVGFDGAAVQQRHKWTPDSLGEHWSLTTSGSLCFIRRGPRTPHLTQFHQLEIIPPHWPQATSDPRSSWYEDFYHSMETKRQ